MFDLNLSIAINAAYVWILVLFGGTMSEFYCLDVFLDCAMFDCYNIVTPKKWPMFDNTANFCMHWRLNYEFRCNIAQVPYERGVELV